MNKTTCSIGNCGKLAKCRGLCGACYSWCRSYELRSPEEKRQYTIGLKFRTTRMLSRFGLLSEGKVIQFKKAS